MTGPRTHGLLLGASVLYVLTLFLDWERAEVGVAGTMHAGAGTMGWAGWGLAGGVCAIAVAGLEIVRLRRGEVHPVAAFLLALGMVAATVVAITGSDVHVQVGTVMVSADATRWPAWLALGLAALATLAAAALLQTAGATGERATGVQR
jgi:hypothetical protein